MRSERLQRQIEQLLDQAEAAIAEHNWGAVRESAQAVLRVDPENADALGYLAIAGEEAAPADSPAPAVPAFVRSSRLSK